MCRDTWVYARIGGVQRQCLATRAPLDSSAGNPGRIPRPGQVTPPPSEKITKPTDAQRPNTTPVPNRAKDRPSNPTYRASAAPCVVVTPSKIPKNWSCTPVENVSVWG